MLLGLNELNILANILNDIENEWCQSIVLIKNRHFVGDWLSPLCILCQFSYNEIEFVDQIVLYELLQEKQNFPLQKGSHCSAMILVNPSNNSVCAFRQNNTVYSNFTQRKQYFPSENWGNFSIDNFVLSFVYLNSASRHYKWYQLRMYKCVYQNFHSMTKSWVRANQINNMGLYSIMLKRTNAVDIDGLEQDCSKSSALPIELLQSCTKQSLYQLG